MGGARPQLIDRLPERETIDGLLAAARTGRSRVLVLRGEAGVGKSALLGYVCDRTDGCRLERATGVQSEIELPFAGLHQLCAPMLESLNALPEPQGNALATAFGMSAGPPPQGFLVGVAVLGLLAEAAEKTPLVCVVDDAQWLDRATANTLAFVARRLLAEHVALVFAVRTGEAENGLAGLPELEVRGLERADAQILLESRIPGPLDGRVRDRILAEARGNPLALLELPHGGPSVAAVRGPSAPRTPASVRVEQSFARRLEPLPPETRRLLLAAAAEPVGDVTLLWRAADRLGIGADAVAPAEAAGLVELGVRVQFRHPLVRSTVYSSAPPEEKRAVHGALADAIDGETDPDRRAWHRAHAVIGADEDVAAELEHSAGRARARGGITAAAAFLERAAELTPDAAERGRRALAAAQARHESGSPDAARRLLEVAELCPLDELRRARLAKLRAEIAFTLRRGRDAPPLFLEAARMFEPLDPAAARETYLQALGTAMYAGRLYAPSGIRHMAEAARAAVPPTGPPRSIDLVLDGMATRFTDGHAAGVPPLRRALRAFRDEPLDTHESTMRWLALCPVVMSLAVFELLDDEAFDALSNRALRLARETGALAALQAALVFRSGVHLFAGDYAACMALTEEAERIAEATGGAGLVYGRLLLTAWRGVDAECRRLIEAARENALERGEGRVLALAGHAEAVLQNGHARYDKAVDAALRATEDDNQGYTSHALVELVEAATRSDRADLAVAALSRLEERTAAAGTDWALGVRAMSRALVADGDADDLYREATERLERTRMRVQLARCRLLHGEWLSRERRPAEARELLRAAHETFTHAGAEAFGARAWRELAALGETVRPSADSARASLTPQEAHIARLAADGRTNPEIGAELFISPRTVEYHLHKVFDKLFITSRKELPVALASAAP